MATRRSFAVWYRPLSEWCDISGTARSEPSIQNISAEVNFMYNDTLFPNGLNRVANYTVSLIVDATISIEVVEKPEEHSKFEQMLGNQTDRLVDPHEKILSL